MKKADLNIPEMKQKSIYNNGDVAIINDFNEQNLQKEAFKTEQLYAVILCLKGKASLYINGNPYVAYENDLFVCPPNVIVENSLLSVDFKCCCICLSVEYIKRIMPMVDNSWDIRILFEKTPLISLNEEEVSTILSYYDLLCSRSERSSGENLEKIMDALMQVFMYEFQNIVNRVARTNLRPFTSREYHFKTFIDLLSSSYPKNRNVAFYADRLCITPKYLSAVCKEIVGQPASKIIDQYVIKDVEYLLKHTRKTIKGISHELGFPNISFFGKYVKNSFGDSPRAFREHFVNAQQK